MTLAVFVLNYLPFSYINVRVITPKSHNNINFSSFKLTSKTVTGVGLVTF